VPGKQLGIEADWSPRYYLGGISILSHAAISDEINRHIEAVVVLSKRDILLRLLREAELCMRLEQVATAAILAGIALEELYLLGDPGILRHRERLEAWRELRNRATDPASGGQEMDPDIVSAMLRGIRALLDQMDVPQSTPSPHMESGFTAIRGKYAFVPTTVDDFLKRKRQDLELEARE